MNRCSIALVAFLLLLVACCDSVEKPKIEVPQPPAAWQHVQLSGFSFYAPPGLQRDPNARGIDSYAGRFTMSGLRVDFDYGTYSAWIMGEYVPIKGAYASTLVVYR